MDTHNVSGPGRQLAEVVTPLAVEGVELIVVCFAHRDDRFSPYVKYLASRGIPHRVVLTRGRIDRQLIGDTLALVRETAPDILQSHSFRPAFIAWLAHQRGVAARWVSFYHGYTLENFKVRLYNIVDFVLMHCSSTLVVVARSQAERFRRRAVHVPNAVLRSGRSSVTSVPARLPGAPSIACIGRLSYEKGVDVLLEAVAGLVSDYPRLHLALAGDGPARESLEATTERLDLRPHVTFLGHVACADDLFDAVDLVVLPSRSEGQPNVLLEALQTGVRIVATRVGDVPDIADGMPGVWLAPSESPTALRTAISVALSATGDSVDASSLLAQRVPHLARFSVETRAQRLASIYRELLAS